MNTLIAKWTGLPQWQRFMALTVVAWAGTWVVLGATAAMAFGFGAALAFLDGVSYAARDK